MIYSWSCREQSPLKVHWDSRINGTKIDLFQEAQTKVIGVIRDANTISHTGQINRVVTSRVGKARMKSSNM